MPLTCYSTQYGGCLQTNASAILPLWWAYYFMFLIWNNLWVSIIHTPPICSFNIDWKHICKQDQTNMALRDELLRSIRPYCLIDKILSLILLYLGKSHLIVSSLSGIWNILKFEYKYKCYKIIVWLIVILTSLFKVTDFKEDGSHLFYLWHLPVTIR